MELKNRKKINQYYTFQKFNEQSNQLKRINRNFGKRGGYKI